MDEKLIRDQIHQAVDAHGAALQEDPFLAQRIIAQTRRKEVPHMKKLSAGTIIAIVLMLLSVTAVAVGLSVEDIWKQSFEKMNTTGYINKISDETEAEITMDEAIAIARSAIIAKYGTPEAELDAMGVYPTYAARGWDGKTDEYPSEWDIYYSSRTNVDLDYDYSDYGPTGEYRVYINAETREVTYCNWYTNDFWSRAQTVWDCGSYDEVYKHYHRTDFFTQSAEMQDYWTQQLAEKGYEIISEAEKLHKVLRSAELDLQFCELTRIADNSDPLVAAAWQALEEQCGLPTETLRKFAYVATLPAWNTGYDDVCIHYSYELEWDMMDTRYLDQWSDRLFTYVNRLGLYMVSFEKGTTNVAAITHVTGSETGLDVQVRYESEGLLTSVSWTAADLAVFDEAYDRLDRAVKRMRAANLPEEEMQVVVLDFLRSLGGDPELYPEAPEEANVNQWFAEASEWDAKITEPEMTYAEFTDKYGFDKRFWPQELLMTRDPRSYRMPREDSDELSVEEAIQRALNQLILEKGESALTDLGDYTLSWHRVSLTADPNEPDCRWEIFITDDPSTAQNGWKITFGEWEHHIDTPQVQHITDMSNG